jgi:predicted amidophosphoribosyltransferase
MEKFSFLPILAGLLCANAVITQDTAQAQPSQELENRPRPEEIERLYTIDTNLVQPIPSEIWIFDDVLTAGTHYRAASSILMKTFPGVPISGYFIARRVPEDSA